MRRQIDRIQISIHFSLQNSLPVYADGCSLYVRTSLWCQVRAANWRLLFVTMATVFAHSSSRSRHHRVHLLKERDELATSDSRSVGSGRSSADVWLILITIRLAECIAAKSLCTVLMSVMSQYAQYSWMNVYGETKPLTDWPKFFLGESYSWCNHACQIWWRSLKGFMGGFGVKFQHFPLTLLVVLTTLSHYTCEREI